MTSTRLSTAKTHLVHCLLGGAAFVAWPMACASDGAHLATHDSDGGEAGAGRPDEAGGSSGGETTTQPSGAGEASGGQASAALGGAGNVAGTTTRGGTAGTAGRSSLSDGGESSLGCEPSPAVLVRLSTDMAIVPGLPISNQRIAISSSFCGTALDFSTHSQGAIYAPKGEAFFLRTSQTGSLPGLSTQFRLDHDTPYPDSGAESLLVAMVTEGQPALLDPEWSNGTRAAILIAIRPIDGTAGACLDPSGVTFGVVGHPEAVVNYGAADGITYGLVKSAGTSTTVTGQAVAFITTTGSWAEPELVEVKGTKAGCRIETAGYALRAQTSGQTGFTPVARGATSGIVFAGLGS